MKYLLLGVISILCIFAGGILIGAQLYTEIGIFLSAVGGSIIGSMAGKLDVNIQ